MQKYLCLSNQEFCIDNFKIVPIRDSDKYLIMKWRNEQIYHLRQENFLTKNDQEKYFNEVVSKLFDQKQPSQILFSFLFDNKCIGYGGLVHTNWKDRHAEISFIIDTSLESEYFQSYWQKYLSLIEIVAFGEMKMHKIFVYAYDLRPNLYHVLENSGFRFEARLLDHVIVDDKFRDVVIYCKLNSFEE